MPRLPTRMNGQRGSLLVLLLIACTQQVEPPPPPFDDPSRDQGGTLPTLPTLPALPAPQAPEPPGGTRSSGGADAPLPEEDEVPAFLQQGRGAGSFEDQPASAQVGSGASPQDPELADESLGALMARVRFEEGGEDEGSFASVIAGGEPVPPRAAPPSASPERDETQDASEALYHVREDLPVGGADPCAEHREAIATRKAYLLRIAQERDSFAYVEDAEDAVALRLLQSLRRCAEHPEDEDCEQPPIEVELRALEPPRHTFESWPTDLEAERKDPNEVAHDPVVRDLLYRLRDCERKEKAQPLLE